MSNNRLFYFILLILIIIILFFFYQNRQRILNLYYLTYFKSEKYSSENFNRSLNYRLFRPKTVIDKKYPLLLILHPAGQNGNDNKRQLSSLVFEWSKNESQKRFPCYILAPQCPEGREWVDKGPMKTPFRHYNQDNYPETDEMKMIVEVINQLLCSSPIDSGKIYVAGFSMGATGCWDILTRHPDLFAGAIISSGVSDTLKAYKLANLPIWAFSGENDNLAPAQLNKTMVEAINRNGGNAKFTLLRGEGHDIGYKSFTFAGVKEWLLSQKKQGE
jgi:predicted peptidase